MEPRSLTEDELEAMEGQARRLTVLDLKKRALAAKQGGDVESAKGYLMKAKKLEAEDSNSESNGGGDEDEPPYSSTLPLFWKKVAILCKQAGDIDRAKQALVHSKDLEAGELSWDAEHQDLHQAAPTPTHDSGPTKGAAGMDEDPPPPLYDDFDSISPPLPLTYDNLIENCRAESVANDEAAAMLAEVMGGLNEAQGQNEASNVVNSQKPAVVEDQSLEDTGAAPTTSGNGNDNNLTDTTPVMTFTDEELMNEEMMREFAAGGVQGIPTQEEYAVKVVAYKKIALKFKKEGNIADATKNLRLAKQLEKVAQALQTLDDKSSMEITGGVPQSWLKTLDLDESQLLGELFDQGGQMADVAFRADVGASTMDRLTLEDLEEMDDDNDVVELVEMMGTDALPTVEDVTEIINEEKQRAVRYKKSGNMELAKSSLLKSKKAKLQAVRLAEIYRKVETRKNKGDSCGIKTDDGECYTPISIEDLEALVGGDPKPRGATKTPKKSSPPKDPWFFKPSAEIKAEVIRLKNAQNIHDATRLLRLFKQKLAEEQKVADQERVSKMVATIQKRLDICTTQRCLWQYYQWFGKEIVVGAGQYQAWTAFSKECQKAIRLLQTEGSASVKLAPRSSAVADTTNNKPPNQKLYLLDDDLTSLVEYCTNDTTAAARSSSTTADNADAAPIPNYLEENALEVAMLGLFKMEENEKLRKILAKKPKSQKAILEEPPDVRIHAKLQLPIEPDDPSKPLLFDLEPSRLSLSRRRLSKDFTTAPKKGGGNGSGSNSTVEFQYDFDPSSQSCRKQVALPRKVPKHERALLRRMETKTIQLSVFYLHNQNRRKDVATVAAVPKKKSWFFVFGEAKASQIEPEAIEAETKDIFLGKVTIEFKPLLSRGCLTGDFPILINSRPIGGVLRVCLRTRPVLDPHRYEGISWSPTDGAPSSLSITSYEQSLSFSFPRESGKAKPSIESIKQENTYSSTSAGCTN